MLNCRTQRFSKEILKSYQLSMFQFSNIYQFPKFTKISLTSYLNKRNSYFYSYIILCIIFLCFGFTPYFFFNFSLKNKKHLYRKKIKSFTLRIDLSSKLKYFFLHNFIFFYSPTRIRYTQHCAFFFTKRAFHLMLNISNHVNFFSFFNFATIFKKHFEFFYNTLHLYNLYLSLDFFFKVKKEQFNIFLRNFFFIYFYLRGLKLPLRF